MTEAPLAIPEVYLPEVEPSEVLARATKRANALMKAVRARRLSIVVAGQEYLRFEAWQLLGAMYGITPVVVQVTETRGEDGVLQRAHVRAEARWRGSVVLSSAESECSRDEVLITKGGAEQRRWEKATDAQILGMAQTRACARALRHCLAWVARLAGFEATPAEEIHQVPLEVETPQEKG